MEKSTWPVILLMSVFVLQSCSFGSAHKDWREISEKGSRARIDNSLSSARQLFKDALKLCEDQRLNDLYLLVSLNNCAMVCLADHKFQEAIGYFERVHEVKGRTKADDLLALFQEARCWAKLGNFDNSISMFKESLALATELSGSKSLQVACVLAKLGDVQFLQGKYSDALKSYLAARKLWSSDGPGTFFPVSAMDERLGYCSEELGDKAAAFSYFKKALAKPTPWSIAKFESFAKENGFPPETLPEKVARVKEMSPQEFYFYVSGIPYAQASTCDKDIVNQIAADFQKMTLESL